MSCRRLKGWLSAIVGLWPVARRPSLAFVATSQDGKLNLWIRSLDSLAAHQVAGTIDLGSQPFWSPDSRFVGSYANGKLKKFDLAGGLPQTLADAFFQTGTWNGDGVILFKPNRDGGLYRIRAAGGPATPVTTLDHARGETAHDWPHFLPDGRHFLYLANSTQPEHDSVLYVASLDAKDRVRLLRSDSHAVYAPPGFLLYMLGNVLVAQPFDAGALHVTGEPIPIAEQVARNPDSRRGAFSVSQTGVLAYRPVGETELVWFDRSGRRLERIAPPGHYSNPALSPDEQRVAVTRLDPQTETPEIWLIELARGLASRFTFGPASDDMPLWSPDGSRIVFKSHRSKVWSFYQKASSGTGPEEILLTLPGASGAPLALSRDGRFLIYASDPSWFPNRPELWLLPQFGDRKPVPFLQTPFSEAQGGPSPDGRWLAYVSDESGRNEVYVRPFPSGEGKWQVSVNGGMEPTWRGDGKEIYYLGAERDLMAVTITAGARVEATRPTRLFRTTMSNLRLSNTTTYTRNQYVFTADGQRFLVNQGTSAAITSPITVVVNWAAALKK